MRAGRARGDRPPRLDRSSGCDELGAAPSLLNPLWYAGAFGIGLAGRARWATAVSLGFVVETERQVEQHLAGHLDRLPAGDTRLARDRRSR